jgi:hypothetical protein
MAPGVLPLDRPPRREAHVTQAAQIGRLKISMSQLIHKTVRALR